MKCPYCGYRMFKDEDSGIKRCFSCEKKYSKTNKRISDEKKQLPPKVKMWIKVFKKMGVNITVTDMEGNPIDVGDDK